MVLPRNSRGYHFEALNKWSTAIHVVLVVESFNCTSCQQIVQNHRETEKVWGEQTVRQTATVKWNRTAVKWVVSGIISNISFDNNAMQFLSLYYILFPCAFNRSQLKWSIFCGLSLWLLEMTRKLEYVDFNQVYFELNFLDSSSNNWPNFFRDCKVPPWRNKSDLTSLPHIVENDDVKVAYQKILKKKCC